MKNPHNEDLPKLGSSVSTANFSYEVLPETFFAHVSPSTFPGVEGFLLNEALARQLSIPYESLVSRQGLYWLAGAAPSEQAAPIALAYSGHQFGHFNPALGDGRARLVGEVRDEHGRLHDIHLKGAGRTPFSRRGDGKATLGSAVREYILSEAMAALGVSTTRSLAVVTTGEDIARQTLSPGAVLARTANSHVRVGTFQHAYASGGVEHVKSLADYCIDRLYPDVADVEQPYRRFLEIVAQRQAELISSWMSLGFIHGVMNTDNMAISGETIDYGPCAFIDVFRPDKTFSSIDAHGRYAWNQQQFIGQWNLARLAETMLPLLGETEEDQLNSAHDVLSRYAGSFETQFQHKMMLKLAVDPENPSAVEFVQRTLNAIADGKADYTRFFSALTRHVEGEPKAIILGAFSDRTIGEDWYEDWRAFAGERDGLSSAIITEMKAANPVRIARNHQVEKAIQIAERDGDNSVALTLLAALRQPYSDDSVYSSFEREPEPEEIVWKTYCGT